MYRTNEKLIEILEQTAARFRDTFGYDMPVLEAFEIYKSQSKAIRHFLKLQESTKMRGLMCFRLNPKRVTAFEIPIVHKQVIKKRGATRRTSTTVVEVSLPDSLLNSLLQSKPDINI